MYCISAKFSKRDKLGIHKEIETLCLEILSLAIETAFRPKQLKTQPLETLRIKTNVLKQLVRTENELGILDEKTYLRISEKLVEISKMANGWITYTQKGAS